MKSFVKLTALALFSAASIASADVTINIVGATAFRAAVHNGLLSSTGLFDGNGGTAGPTTYAHDKASGLVSGAGRSSWKGNVTGYGTVIVRCFWTGSVQGIKDVTAGNAVQFLADSTIAGTGENALGTASPLGTAQAAQFTFADCKQASTEFISPELVTVPVGVIVFSYAVNDTSATGATTLLRYGFDNITAQAAKKLRGSGSMKKRALTGVTTDTKPIYSVGRDIGSGTRVIELAETGYGVFTNLKHYKLTAGTGGALGTLIKMQLWPTGTKYATTGNDPTIGNGGYTSGGTLAGLMADKSDGSVDVLGTDGTTVLATVTGGIHYIGCFGISDATTVFNGGGAYLNYEGTSYQSTSDNAKVASGKYTLWSYENLMNVDTISTDQAAIRDLLVPAIDTNIGTAGIKLGDMSATRDEDGGLVAP